jgi:hypothetical protein
MPRLTRTQKFADLRDSLANDREPSLSTKDLSDYENKLSNISDQLSNNETVNKAPEAIKEETDPRYVWTSFQEPKTNPVDELVETIRDREFEKTLTQTSAFNSIQELPTQKVDPLVEEFKAEDLSKDSDVQKTKDENAPMIKTKPVPDIDFMIDDILASNQSADDILANKVVTAKEPEQVEVEPVQEVNPFMEDVMNAEQNGPFVNETEEVEEERQVIEETPVEEVTDNHVVEHVDVYNDYIDETINEVSDYNRRNGETTISDLTSNMVNEIRHHVEPEYERPVVQEPVYEEPVITEAVIENQENEVSDEEFSNTVSMEISKIMDEISTIEPSQKTEVEYTYSEPEDPQQYIDAPDEIEEVDAVEVEEYVEEHPVLAKKLEEEKVEEEVVEIKNLKELEAEPIKQTGTISNTIPFVVATEEEDIIDEDDEDEGSNTILNIILVVLIIVLVAVLGLIIFYILKTKGII